MNSIKDLTELEKLLTVKSTRWYYREGRLFYQVSAYFIRTLKNKSEDISKGNIQYE